KRERDFSNIANFARQVIGRSTERSRDVAGARRPGLISLSTEDSLLPEDSVLPEVGVQLPVGDLAVVLAPLQLLGGPEQLEHLADGAGARMSAARCCRPERRATEAS